MKEISIPGDKSISHRSLLIGSLCRGKTRIKNLLRAGDIFSTIACLKGLGIRIEETEDGDFVVEGGCFKKPDGILDCGNSGTTIRLLSGILAGQEFEATLDGDSSLRKRPMKRVGEPLTLMGANIIGDYPPIKVKGSYLKGITYKLPVASAQVKSAILLAGLMASGKTTVIEPLPSRDHTERMLEFFGVPIERDGSTICIDGPVEISGDREITVPPDFSSSAFFIAGGLLIDHPIIIRNVNINQTRTGFLECLKKMGANFEILNKKLLCNEPVGDIVVKKSRLHGINIGKEIVPRMIDEIPILAILACFAEGRTKIEGAEELRVKESDRISSIASGLSKLGARIEELPDGMVIDGGYPLKGATIDSYDDHRIAMAFSIASLVVEKIEIKGKECVDISFPSFFDILYSIDTSKIYR
ncbi:TPA: 3-phosphoshikimate 1-carboxyvinyltransferase [bacterium]|nr:3-phosphoshikimate 1-carboxyvinyltransferase [bacterium]